MVGSVPIRWTCKLNPAFAAKKTYDTAINVNVLNVKTKLTSLVHKWKWKLFNGTQLNCMDTVTLNLVWDGWWNYLQVH